jgi:hypothetical protein
MAEMGAMRTGRTLPPRPKLDTRFGKMSNATGCIGIHVQPIFL